MNYNNFSSTYPRYNITKFFNNIGKLKDVYIADNIYLLKLEISFECYASYKKEFYYRNPQTKMEYDHPVIVLQDDCENTCYIELSEFDTTYKIWSVSNDDKFVYITVYKKEM